MTTNPHDHHDLTAHVLGELDAEHAEAMAHWIAENPDATAEAAEVRRLADHLHATALATTLRLHPHQREAVLSAPQRVRQMVAQAAQSSRRRSSVVMPVLRTFIRVAAAAAFIIAGFVAGTHYSARPKSSGPTAAKESASSPAATASAVSDTPPPPALPPLRAKEIPVPTVADAATKAPAPTAAPSTAEPGETLKKTESVAVVTAKVPDLPAQGAPAPAKPVLVRNQVLAGAFVSTTKSAVAQTQVRPSMTRPAAPVVKSDTVAAAPILRPAATPAPAPTRPADLLIHSWKAEVASCPWDESHRLLRVVLQIPGEQAAAANDATFVMRATFDPNNVRSFRQLGHRTIAASGPEQPAFHIAWFEFTPNGPSREGVARTIGSITVANSRFTTPAMAAFDASTLQVLDRGTKWPEAGQDFIYESAVSGFGLLLQGAKDAGTLNHALVLSLAQRTLQDDSSGERARFVKTVKEAQRAAGL